MSSSVSVFNEANFIFSLTNTSIHHHQHSSFLTNILVGHSFSTKLEILKVKSFSTKLEIFEVQSFSS